MESNPYNPFLSYCPTKSGMKTTLVYTIELSNLRPCLVWYFSSLNFHHLSLITLKYYTCLAPSLSYHQSIFFTLFVGPITVTRCNFFFPPRTQKPEPNERRKEKKSSNHPNPVKEERKKKKKNPGEERPRGEDQT